MESTYLFDLGEAILCFGVVFYLAGGAGWVEQKIRQLRLDNDRKEAELKAGKADQ